MIDCDPEMFNFLFQHPEIVIDVWRMMGISQVSLEKLPGGAYRGTDGAGTTGVVRFLHTNFGPNAQNVAVIFADGTYEGKPFVKPLKAQSILLLHLARCRKTTAGITSRYASIRLCGSIKWASSWWPEPYSHGSAKLPTAILSRRSAS